MAKAVCEGHRTCLHRTLHSLMHVSRTVRRHSDRAWARAAFGFQDRGQKRTAEDIHCGTGKQVTQIHEGFHQLLSSGGIHTNPPRGTHRHPAQAPGKQEAQPSTSEQFPWYPADRWNSPQGKVVSGLGSGQVPFARSVNVPSDPCWHICSWGWGAREEQWPTLAFSSFLVACVPPHPTPRFHPFIVIGVSNMRQSSFRALQVIQTTEARKPERQRL